MAFEHAATNEFDKDLIVHLADFAGLRARLKKERSITLPEPPKSATALEFADYLVETRQLMRASSTEPIPQLVRQKYPRVTLEAWANLSDEGRDVVVQRAATEAPANGSTDGSSLWKRFLGKLGGAVPDAVEMNELLDEHGDSEFDALLESSPSVIGEANRTLEALIDRLKHAYEYRLCSRDSELLSLTYRQEWSPVRYQVGRLVDTIPLTPGERREFRVMSFSQGFMRIARPSPPRPGSRCARSSVATKRLESEAIEAATMAINNQLSSNGSFQHRRWFYRWFVAIHRRTSRPESRMTLKNFAEMARKAVDSLKEQVEVTIEDTTDLATESTEARTVLNPNNEITVTYLLYELERRYRVATQLQRVRPVILVALPVPSPDEITPAWILEYSWAIREALLDETLRLVLDGLEEAQSGAAIQYEVRRAALRGAATSRPPARHRIRGPRGCGTGASGRGRRAYQGRGRGRG